jgi:3-(3-hydroxy-phenyl)propionate hydroxylase
MDGGRWGVAVTRSLLGVRLDVDGTGDWSMIASGDAPQPVGTGDRLPDVPVFGPRGQVWLHDLTRDSFAALYFTDVRRRPWISGVDVSGLNRYLVSRWDAPMDSGLRERTLFDPGERATRRIGVLPDTAVLVRPDGHVAAILPIDPADRTKDPVGDVYVQITQGVSR